MVELTFDNEELSKRLQEFIDKGLYDALKTGLTRACIEIEDEAKRNCPTGDGQLRQSITHDVIATKENVVGIVGSNVEYAPYVEVGTGIYNATGRKTPWSYQDARGIWHTTRGMKARPYLQPAADSKQQEILNAFEGLV